MEAHEYTPHEHDHSELVRDSKLAARLNLATGVGKTILGLFALSPVLITDGAHDFGDYDTYISDAKAIEESDPQKKAQRKIRAGFKLGSYAVAGTLLETLVEQSVEYSPIPLLSLLGGVGSLAFNTVIHRRFSHHTHHEAEEVQGHGRADLVGSAVTIGASVASFVWLPALFAGSLAHIGIYSFQAVKTYRKFKNQAHGSV